MTDPLVWDASALHHFARAERVDVLAHLAEPYRNVTTRVVMRELANYDLDGAVLAPGWLSVVPLDDLPELTAYVDWASRLAVRGSHDAGEATVLAWAEVHGAVALLDDHHARQQARRTGIHVHGTLWLVAQAVARGSESDASVAGLLRTVSDAGARYPSQAVSDFGEWRRSVGLKPTGCCR